MRSNPKIQDFVKSVWRSFQSGSGLEPRLLTNLRITGARLGCVQFQLHIERQHTNRLKTLHGGTIASMVDVGGSLAVASHGLFATGVSTDIHAPAAPPVKSSRERRDAIRVVGKNLAFTTVHFTNEKNQVFARGSHTKYIVQARLDQGNKVDEIQAAEVEFEKQE